MHAERAFIFACFGVGLINTLLALMSAAWILMTFEVALVATLGISWSIYIIIRQARRIYSKFGLSQEDVVRFDDIISNAPRSVTEEDRADVDRKHPAGGNANPRGRKQLPSIDPRLRGPSGTRQSFDLITGVERESWRW